MRPDDLLTIFFFVVAFFVAMLFKPQITNWWMRRRKVRETEREARLNRELRKWNE